MILREAGTRRRRADSGSFTRNPLAFETGERRFDFDRGIYAHETVKETLFLAQHGKCCFCEARLGHNTFGDIEHFRPKGAVRQDDETPLARPGYYWLAYEWTNLYLCCEVCNVRHKASLFPLANPADRVRTHRDAQHIGREQPLFIDPGGEEDPERLIGFRDEVPFARGGDRRAAVTIRELGLDRLPLVQDRRERLQPLAISVAVIEGARRGRVSDQDLVSDAASVLATHSRSAAEYAAAVRAMLRARLHPRLRLPVERDELVSYAGGGELPILD